MKKKIDFIEDVLFAKSFEKDFFIANVKGITNPYSYEEYITYIDNPKLSDMDFIDQYDPNDLSDDLYIDGIEVINRIDNELHNTKNNSNEDIENAVVNVLTGIINKK